MYVTRWRQLLLALLLSALHCCPPVAAGNLTGQAVLAPTWQQRLMHARELPSPGAQVTFLSAAFLGTPYQAHTLIGSAAEPEQLTVNFAAVDCFTLLDYVEALRRSQTPERFADSLTDVRYRDGRVSWTTRRHFFTDWVVHPTGPILDVTRQIGGAATRQVEKQLNRRQDGSLWLPGVPVVARTLDYLPVSALDEQKLAALKTGDYLGFYSPAPGLDVSHTGILIRTSEGLFLRHASSASGVLRVVDAPFRDYLAKQHGLIVFRPQPQ